MTALLPPYPEPAESNGFLVGHLALLRGSYHRLTGRDLVDPGLGDADAARALWDAPFALLSHDTAPDPVLTYGNRTVLGLFELDWARLTAMPSRLTAEAPERAERERLLAAVAARGYIDDYAGVRVSARGRRFRIAGACVWNLVDADGRRHGQAATFAAWEPLAADG